MKIKRVELENWKGISAAYPLGDLTYIQGPNGSGKSAIITALQFALEGKLPHSGKANAARLAIGPTSDAASVLLEFDEAAVPVIARCVQCDRDGKTHTRLDIDDRMRYTQTEAQQAVNDWCGALPVMFDVTRFTALSDDKRRAALWTLLAGDGAVSAADILQDRLEVERYESTLARLPMQSPSLDVILERTRDLKNTTKATADRAAVTRRGFVDQLGTSQRTVDKQASLTITEDHIGEINTRLQAIAEKIATHGGALAAIRKCERQRDEAQREIDALSGRRDRVVDLMKQGKKGPEHAAELRKQIDEIYGNMRDQRIEGAEHMNTAGTHAVILCEQLKNACPPIAKTPEFLALVTFLGLMALGVVPDPDAINKVVTLTRQADEIDATWKQRMAELSACNQQIDEASRIVAEATNTLAELHPLTDEELEALRSERTTLNDRSARLHERLGIMQRAEGIRDALANATEQLVKDEAAAKDAAAVYEAIRAARDAWVSMRLKSFRGRLSAYGGFPCWVDQEPGARGALRFGWIDADDNKIDYDVLSGGERVRFDAALLGTLLSFSSAPLRMLLVDVQQNADPETVGKVLAIGRSVNSQAGIAVIVTGWQDPPGTHIGGYDRVAVP